MPYDETDYMDELLSEELGRRHEERIAMAIELDNKAFIDFYLGSNSEQMQNAITGLVVELRTTTAASGGHTAGLTRALTVLIANMISNYAADPLRYTAYRSHHNGYPSQRYNPLLAKWRGMERVIDGLEELGYVFDVKGHQHPEYGTGYISRIRAEPEFIELLAERYGFTSDHVERFSNPELVELRDAERKQIDYEDTESTRAMRNQLNSYNDVLRSAEIAVSLTEEQILELEGEPLHLSRKSYHRVFNRESFTLGGRFYGPWWQLASQEVRKHIQIDGEDTVECDYSAQHVHILYSLMGLQYYSEHDEGDDPYAVPGYEEIDRKLLKLVGLIILSAATKNGAATAIRNRIRENSEWSGLGVNVSDLLAGFKTKHEPIGEYLFSGSGLMLQYQDSCISQFVIQKCLDEGIVALDIHDSFIVQRPHMAFLKENMEEAFRVCGLISIPPIKDNIT